MTKRRLLDKIEKLEIEIEQLKCAHKNRIFSELYNPFFDETKYLMKCFDCDQELYAQDLDQFNAWKIDYYSSRYEELKNAKSTEKKVD